MKRATAKPNIKTKVPGPNAKKWVKFHLQHASEATYNKKFVWDRKAPAIGPFCTDPDGNIFLDFASHVASSPLGYNHPKLTKLATKLAAINPDRYAGTDFIGAYGKDPKKSSVPTPSHLHQKVMEITKQFGFDKGFFVNSGAEAVENAMKLCFAARPKAKYVVTFEHDFHGRTLGALSLSSSKKIQNQDIPQIPNIIRLPYKSCKGDVCHFEKQEPLLPKNIKPKDVAFIILEPIQGEGGYNFPNPLFLQEVQRTASKYNISLICDEIQTGMGRTGKWWASEHFGLKPDMITVGKALRVGAAIGKEELFPKESGRVGSTWGEGNAIASAIGYATIDIIQKENLLQNATTLGHYFLQELKKLKPHQVIEDIRGLGLLLVIEMKSQAQRDKLLDAMLQKGLLALGCGYTGVRLLPPLNVTKREINLALEIIQTCTKKLR